MFVKYLDKITYIASTFSGLLLFKSEKNPAFVTVLKTFKLAFAVFQSVVSNLVNSSAACTGLYLFILSKCQWNVALRKQKGKL